MGGAIQVASMLKTDYVWGILGHDIYNSPGWISVSNATEEELTSMREYIEALYEDEPSSLPDGDVGGRMMIRYLNGRIPKNRDNVKSLLIRTVCVYPRAVNLEWEDEASQKHKCVISEKEMVLFSDYIKQQMDKWRCLLFEISGGKFSLDYSIQCSDKEMNSLRRDKGCYRLRHENAKELICTQKNIMLYIFWLPRWKDSPPSGCIGHFLRPYRNFRAPYITLYTTEKRLKRGFVYLDGGLPHEFWQYLLYIADKNGFKGFMARGHKPADWAKLKQEIASQGLPVPQKAHEEQYANLITWRFIKALKQKYDPTQQNKTFFEPVAPVQPYFQIGD